MAVYQGLSGNSYTTHNTAIAENGNSSVFNILNESGLTARIFKPEARTAELEHKLTFMVSSAPGKSTLYEWPQDVLYENGQFAGLLIPKISGKISLHDCITAEKRSAMLWSYYVAAARSLADAVRSVHAMHQVIGNLDPKYILVHPENGSVTLVKTESFHIAEETRTYRCGTGIPEYTAPELQGIVFPTAPLPTFTEESDRFSLSVLIFTLLMHGAHPYLCGNISDAAPSFQPNEPIQSGKCAFFGESRAEDRLPKYAPDVSALPEDIQKLFFRAFCTGHRQPDNRPSAEEWYQALTQLSQNLTACRVNRAHIYYSNAKCCPWCAIAQQSSAAARNAQNGTNTRFIENPGTPTGKPRQAQKGAERQNTQKPQQPQIPPQPPLPPRMRFIGCIAAGVFLLLLILLIKGCFGGRQPESEKHSVAGYSSVSQNEASRSEKSEKNSDSQNSSGKNSSDSRGKTVESSAKPESSSESESEDHRNNTYSGASGIKVNARYRDSLSAPKDQDWFIFKLNKSGLVNVRFYSANQSDSNTYWDICVKSDKDTETDLWNTRVKGTSTETSSGSLSLPAGSYYFRVRTADVYSNASYSFQITYSDTVSQSIAPIQENPLVIDPIPEAASAVDSQKLETFSGSITSQDQKKEHRFTPTVTGTYRFEFTDIADGTYFRLWICNANGDSFKDKYEANTGDGVTVTLNANTTYIVRVGYYKNTGSYTLIVGKQKPVTDISDLTKISDSVQFTDQENNYKFIPARNGTYRFEFDGVPDGTDLKLLIYNGGWEHIRSDYDMDNGDGITLSLTGGKTYYVRVTQYRNVGSYTLLIGKQQHMPDVTPYTLLSDSIQYTNQKNNYRFQAAISGEYRFEFTNVPEGTDLKLLIYNSGWEHIRSDYDMDTGDGITIALDKGQEIIICVEYYRAFGTYDLILGQPKPTVPITNVDRVTDSVQYTQQRNVYSLEAPSDGTYTFTLQDVPDGVYFNMKIVNSGWEYQKSESNIQSGDGLSITLNQGQKIYVLVTQSRNFGSYSLNIIKK